MNGSTEWTTTDGCLNPLNILPDKTTVGGISSDFPFFFVGVIGGAGDGCSWVNKVNIKKLENIKQMSIAQIGGRT